MKATHLLYGAMLLAGTALTSCQRTEAEEKAAVEKEKREQAEADRLKPVIDSIAGVITPEMVEIKNALDSVALVAEAGSGDADKAIVRRDQMFSVQDKLKEFTAQHPTVVLDVAYYGRTRGYVAAKTTLGGKERHVMVLR